VDPVVWNGRYRELTMGTGRGKVSDGERGTGQHDRADYYRGQMQCPSVQVKCDHVRCVLGTRSVNLALATKLNEGAPDHLFDRLSLTEQLLSLSQLPDDLIRYLPASLHVVLSS